MANACKRMGIVAWLMLLAGMPPVAHAQLTASQDVVTAEVVWSSPQARPGDQRVLALVVDVAEHHHINPDAAQAQGVEGWSPYPSKLEVATDAAGLVIGPAQFPAPHALEVEYFSKPVMIYEGRAVIYVPVAVDADAAPGPRTLSLSFVYQACDDTVCYPPRTIKLDAVLEVTRPDVAGVVGQDHGDLFAAFDSSVFSRMGGQWVVFDIFGWSFRIDASATPGFLLLLSIAALGGLLLNFTPCVLPVIPIKIISLSQAAGHRARCFLLGVFMSLGVIVFWLGMGVTLASITGFDAVNKLFQYPSFTIAVGVIIAAMAVGMCGLFVVRLPQVVYSISPKHDSLAGSFGFGVMTAVLSTPCTAPFMGAAASWALKQSPAVVLGTFAAIGAGMALPYLILSASPKLVDKMPRTGPASELIKQVMGLLMLAAAAYFVGVGAASLVATPPDPTTLFYWWPVAAFIIAAGGWLVYRTWLIVRRPVHRAAWSVAGVAVILAGAWVGVHLSDRGPVKWVYYTPHRFEEALAAGNVVVMDFTAEWCLNCKTLEHAVLFSDSVAKRLNAAGVTPIKVDITRSDNTQGNAMLNRVGRATIPLLVVFSPDGREVFKSDAYTSQQVLDAVEQAAGGQVAGTR